MPLCYRASPIRLSRCADADRLCGYSCIGKGASYRAIVLSRYIVCIGAGVLALVGVLHQMSGSAPSCNRAGGRAIWAAGQQAAGVSYRAMHRAIGQLLGVGQTGRLRPCGTCRTCGRLAGIRSVAIARYGLPPTRLCGVVVIRGDVPAWYLALSRYHAEHAAGWQASGVSYRAMHRAIGAPMRPCAGRLHRRRTACAVSRMHVRGGAGAVCRNGINRAAVGVSYQAPVIPPAVGRELACCWVGLRASAHLARAVMLIHCAAIDLDCIAKGMASIG